MKRKILASLIALTAFSNTAYAAPMGANPLASQPFYNQTATGYDLKFNDSKGVLRQAEFNGKTIQYRAFEKIVYLANPIEPEYQTLNFYVPEAYFQQGKINGFTAQTAPIFLPNSVGGYMPAAASTAENTGFGGVQTNLYALSKGYVVAAVGARGRTLGTANHYTGKAPAVIIDLKAAVRYLHANDKLMAGDANKIISNGTSAGGAMSALLGASAQHKDYEHALKQAGALNASDKIFAVSAYCPITNLENADTAYEWEFNGVNDYIRMDMSKLNATSYNDRSKAKTAKIEGTLSAAEVQLSEQLKKRFPSYLNSLKLKDEHGKALTLNANGEGSFKQYIKSLLISSAAQAHQAGKLDLSQTAWIKQNKGKITDLDWNGWLHNEKRMKLPPAFDALDLSSGENNFFGDSQTNNKHFTPFAMQHNTAEQAQMADKNIVHMVNAMNYTANPNGAKHWRIRVGTSDRDTSHAISAMLAIKLKMSGKQVDYALPWGVPHSGDYDLDELFAWTDSISRSSK